MTALVFVMCSAAAFLCAFLLFRRWRATPHTSFLLFAALAFVGLGVNNALVYADLVLIPDADLAVWRKVPALVGMTLLVFGLVREPL